MALDLADVVYSYPDVDDPDFQSKISSKFEFSSLKTSPTEPVPARGKPFKHQAIILRYMLQYERLFLVHEPGTGKTCSSVFAAESNFRREIAGAISDYLLNYIQPRKTNIQRIYVLTRGPTLRDEFLYQIICRCTTRYDTESLNSVSNEVMRERKIHTEVNKSYSVYTYGGLVREVVGRNLTDAQIAEEFSNSFFIIDEPQYLADPELGEDKNSYDGLHRIIHLAKNSKVMATTATPMIDKVKEIAPTLNLVLPLDKQLPLNADYSKVTLEEMAPYLSGYISYIRAFDTGVEIIFQGEPLTVEEQASQMVVYPSLMGDIQNQAYEKNYSIETEKTKKNFYLRERQISNFVFPDGSFGKAGLEAHVDIEGDVYTAKPEFAAFARRRENLNSMSGKFSAALDLLGEKKGTHFVYSNSKSGAGGPLFAAIIKLYGYKQFLGNMSVFGEKNEDNSYCLSTTPSFLERKIKIGKERRFALIVPEMPNARRRSVLELFNSYENRYGDYIKVLIASPVAKAGINLSNVTSVQLLDSDWNEGGNYQAISRAVRATSHLALLQEAREIAIEEGRDPSTARVPINVYRHVSIPEEDITPVDVLIYAAAEAKNIAIHRMLRILKQIAFDCQLTKDSNVRPGDVDFSPICDYMECDYQCFNPAPTQIDYSSFDVLYTEPYLDEISEEIKKLFYRFSALSLSRLLVFLPTFPERYILRAVNRMIREKIPLLDLYNRKAFLREADGYLYLEYEISSTAPSFALSFYTQNLVGVERISLEEISLLNKSQDIEYAVETLLTTDPANPDWEETFLTLNTIGLSLLIETAISSKLKLVPLQISKEVLEAISEKFYGLYMYLHEPVPQIKAYASRVEKKKRGRPSKKGNLPNLSKINFGEASLPKNTPIVYIHTVHEIKRTKAEGRSKKGGIQGRIRILKPSEKVWRDATLVENKVYSRIFSDFIATLHDPYESYPIYGIYRRINETFSIRDKTTENISMSGKDLRFIKDGRVCTSWSKPDLIHLIYQLGIPVTSYTVRLTYPELLEELEKRKVFNETDPEDTFTEEKALYFYRWLVLSGAKKKDLCAILYTTLEDGGKILVL